MGWWQRYLGWRHRNVVRLVLLHDGFRLMRAGGATDVRWGPITTITAYKRDLYTTDLLCLLIEADGVIVEIDEEMEGYQLVETALESALDFPPEWKLAALFPPFESNVTPLFDRRQIAA